MTYKSIQFEPAGELAAGATADLVPAAPGGAVERPVPNRRVAAGDENVKLVGTSRDGGNAIDAVTAQVFREAAPGRAVPPLVIQSVVAADNKYIDAVGTPGNGGGSRGASAAQTCPTGPGGAEPRIVPCCIVAADDKDVEPLRTP